MIGNNEDQAQYQNSVLEIIYKDASESCKSLQDNINSINTRLTLLIGFNATFASLLPKLAVQDIFFIKAQTLQEFDGSSLYAIQILNILIQVINWIISIKPIIGLLLGTSVTLAIVGAMPTSAPIVIQPKKMIENGKARSEQAFMIEIIQTCDDIIQELQDLIEKKAAKLKYALMTLTSAELLTVLDLLINANN